MKTKSKSGMSLLTTLIAVGLLSVVTLGIMQTVSSGFKSQRRLASKSALELLSVQVLQVLSAGNACTQMLQTKTFDPTPGTLADQRIPNAANPNPLVLAAPNDPSIHLLEIGKTLSPDSEISNLEIANFLLLDTNVYSASIEIQVETGVQNQQTTTQIAARVPIKIVTEDVNATTKRIVSCTSASTGGGGGGGSATTGLHSYLVRYIGGAGALTITVPVDVTLVEISTHANSVMVNSWESEDTVILHGLISLTDNNWSGFRSLTGGNGAAQTHTIIWNNSPFGANVAGTGDNSAWGWSHEWYVNNHPRIDWNSTTRVLTLSNHGPGTNQTAFLIKYFQ